MFEVSFCDKIKIKITQALRHTIEKACIDCSSSASASLTILKGEEQARC